MGLFKHKQNKKDDIISYKEADLEVPFSLICDNVRNIRSAAEKILSSTHRPIVKVNGNTLRKGKSCGKSVSQNQILYYTAKAQLLKFILISAGRELRGIRAYSLFSGMDNADFTKRIEETLFELNLLLTHSRLRGIIPKNTSRRVARIARIPLEYKELENYLKRLRIHCGEYLELIKDNNDHSAKNTDWGSYDVLVGSFGSKEQFEDNFARKYYYAPAAFIKENKMPVKYIALYQSKKFSDAGLDIL